MKKFIIAILNMLIIITMLVGCADFIQKPSENLQARKNDTIENIDNNTNGKIILEPTIPKWSLEQTTGADMVDIDYASDGIVIFHGCFGLFVYDLNKLNIIRSLDLKPIHCNYTQGDAYCNVEVSKDGNTVQLHADDSKKMYIYSVSDNTLCETNYSPMENSFKSQLIYIGQPSGKSNGAYSSDVVKFNSGEYGYLTFGQGTLGTLNYVRGDTIYSLFKSGEKSDFTRNKEDPEKTIESQVSVNGEVIELLPVPDNNLNDDEQIRSDNSGKARDLPVIDTKDLEKVQDLPVPDIKSKVTVNTLN